MTCRALERQGVCANALNFVRQSRERWLALRQLRLMRFLLRYALHEPLVAPDQDRWVLGQQSFSEAGGRFVVGERVAFFPEHTLVGAVERETIAGHDCRTRERPECFPGSRKREPGLAWCGGRL